MRWRSALVALLALVVAGSCGRKAPPLPPILEVPETTTDLWMYQDGNDVVLNWSYPQLTRAGRRLTDLARIEVWRVEVPPGQEQLAPQLRQELLLTRGKMIAKLEGASLVAATRGSSLTYRDPLPEVMPGTTPPFLWYAVRSRRRDGTVSALSNMLSWQQRPVPPTPTGLMAEPSASGITLCWDEVPDFTYVVERRAPDGAWDLVSPVGITEPTFQDTTAKQDETWSYRVRAYKELTASPPTPVVEVPYPDIYPPPPPTRLVCLPEPGAVRLRWDPSPEGDVAYEVLRRVDEGTWETLAAKAIGVEYVDSAPPAGDVSYSIRAIDPDGNLSPEVTCSVRTSP
jgi:hypothetical protein